MDRRWILAWVVMAIVSIGAVGSASANPPHSQRQFVPNRRAFWDNSKNWTTNYGPAYRDTVEQPSQMLACTTQFALCFHSGPEPYPCKLSPKKHSAQCKCTVETATNYTVITSILNYPVYLNTVEVCGADGSGCPNAGDAPVCKFLDKGKLIPGANVISTFDVSAQSEVADALVTGSSAVTSCDKAPYAACMTAPCHLNKDGTTATCKCPVFYGKFHLIGAGAQCSLGGNLVPSAAYYPPIDINPFN